MNLDSNARPDPAIHAIGEFSFNPRTGVVEHPDGRRSTLRPQTAAVFELLLHNAYRLISKVDLLNTIWPDRIVTEDSLTQCVVEIRRAIDDRDHRVLINERKRGYRLKVPINDPNMPPPTPDSVGFVQRIRFTDSDDGFKLAYAVSGQGQPVLKTARWSSNLEWEVHSPVCSPYVTRSTSWQLQVRHDSRGCGLSDHHAPIVDLDQHVEDMRAVHQASGVGPCPVVSPPPGCPIAIRYAARYPERVTRLVLVGTNARGIRMRGGHSMPETSFNAILQLMRDGWGDDNDAVRQLVTSAVWPGASAQQQRAFNFLQKVTSTGETTARRFAAYAHFDALDDAQHVQCPTLLMVSARNRRWPLEEAQLVASRIPRAELHVLDTDNQTPLYDEPAFKILGTITRAFLSPRP